MRKEKKRREKEMGYRKMICGVILDGECCGRLRNIVKMEVVGVDHVGGSSGSTLAPGPPGNPAGPAGPVGP